MKNDRRYFLKRTSLAGIGLAGAGVIGCSRQPSYSEPFPVTHRQSFNMSGYAVPKLDVVRVGVIGIGARGSGTVMRFAGIEGVEIKALCDLVPERVSKAIESISHLDHKPDSYVGGEDEWKKLCERADIDLISINTPAFLHTPMCVYAMEHEKHAYTELPAAGTIDECWQLVETSERTRKHCVQDSVTCHGGFHYDILAVLLNMVRQGFFGDIIHAEGAYIHGSGFETRSFTKDDYYLWRMDQYRIGRHGNIYPQHCLVPIMQMMDINYGEKMEFLTSVSSDDFIMAETAKKMAAEDDFWKPYVGRDYNGNINNSIIRTNKGRTILLQFDLSSPRPQVRFNIISGTKGIYNAGGSRITTSNQGRIATGTRWISEEEFNSHVEKYTPRMTKVFNEIYEQADETLRAAPGYRRPHPRDWRLVDCLRNGLPLDTDVYEAATSSSITPLSVWSVANRSNSVNVPDFTSGAWKTNRRGMDINFERGGGTTRLI